MVSPEVGLLGAALTVTSPLQLAMGRRALQDETFCAALLLFFLALTPILTGVASRRRYLFAILSFAFALSIKETAVLLYPAVLLLLGMAIRQRGWRREDLGL